MKLIKKVLRNDFMKWHMAFIIPYISTYIIGRLRGSSALAYKIHPYFGVATIILPLIVYILSKKKRLIRQMIKSNFNLKCKPLMKVARLSTLVIMFYFIFSIISGIMMNYGIYGSVAIYKFISAGHRVANILVPVTISIHVLARILLKKK